MSHEGVEKKIAVEARRNGILSLLSHAKEFGLHLDNYRRLWTRMLGWMGLRMGVQNRCDQTCILSLIYFCLIINFDTGKSEGREPRNEAIAVI